MSLEKAAISPGRETTSLEDQDSQEHVKDRMEPNQLLTNCSLCSQLPSIMKKKQQQKKTDMNANSQNRLFSARVFTENPNWEKS